MIRIQKRRQRRKAEQVQQAQRKNSTPEIPSIRSKGGNFCCYNTLIKEGIGYLRHNSDKYG